MKDKKTEFNRSAFMIPKFAKLRKLKERGVIPYSFWVFERKLCESCGKLRGILYPHSCGLMVCCDCWRLGRKHSNHLKQNFHW